MKKLILSLIFVLATNVSFINATKKSNCIEETIQIQDCFEVYQRTRDFVHGMTGSLHIGIAAAISAEEACINEEEELEIIE